MNGNGNDPIIQERWRWLDLPEVCNALGIRPSTLFYYLNNGALKMSQHAGRFCVRDVEVERFKRQRAENLARCGRPKRDRS